MVNLHRHVISKGNCLNGSGFGSCYAVHCYSSYIIKGINGHVMRAGPNLIIFCKVPCLFWYIISAYICPRLPSVQNARPDNQGAVHHGGMTVLYTCHHNLRFPQGTATVRVTCLPKVGWWPDIGDCHSKWVENRCQIQFTGGYTRLSPIEVPAC